MKLKTVLIISTAALFFNACGSSGDGGTSGNDAIDAVDNSVQAWGHNGIGYYGADVVLGNDIAAGKWELTPENPSKADKLTLLLDADANGILIDPNNVNPNNSGKYEFYYGITKDGRVMKSDEKIEFTLYRSISSSCYKAHIDNSHIDNVDKKNISKNESFDVTACKK